MSNPDVPSASLTTSSLGLAPNYYDSSCSSTTWESESSSNAHSCQSPASSTISSTKPPIQTTTLHSSSSQLPSNTASSDSTSINSSSLASPPVESSTTSGHGSTVTSQSLPVKPTGSQISSGSGAAPATPGVTVVWTPIITSITITSSGRTFVTVGTTTGRSTETIISASTSGGGSSYAPLPSNVGAATRGSTSSNTAKTVGGIVVASVILMILIFGFLWYWRTRRRRAARKSVWFSPQAGSAMTSGLLNRSASNGSSSFYTAEGKPDDVMSANNHVSPTYRYGATSQALVSSTLLVVPPSRSSDEICTVDSDPFADPIQHVLEQPAIIVPVEVPMDHAPLPNTIQDSALFLGGGGLLAWEVPLHSARNSIMVPGHEGAIRTSMLSDRSGEVQSVEAI